jgi:hypothetical protein
MSIDSATELASFQRFISERLVNGEGDLSPEEAVDQWRTQNPSLAERDETVAAIQESLAAYEAGDHGVSLDEFDRQFRHRRDLGQ